MMGGFSKRGIVTGLAFSAGTITTPGFAFAAGFPAAVFVVDDSATGGGPFEVEFDSVVGVVVDAGDAAGEEVGDGDEVAELTAVPDCAKIA